MHFNKIKCKKNTLFMITTTKFRTRTLFASVVLLLAVTWSANAQTIKTVGTGGDYGTLKAAFDAINAGTITGEIELQIVSSTTESATATLYQSGYTGGGGTSDYSSVKIYPTSAGISISGGSNTPMIEINGADNVTFDGRVNQSGNEIGLTFYNNTWNLSPAIFLHESSDNDTFKYCKFKTNSYAIYITEMDITYTVQGIADNDDILIEYNEFTCYDDFYRPGQTIRASGKSTSPNDRMIIRNNKFYDVLQKGYQSQVIQIVYYNSNFTITGNSFYETNPVIPEYNGVLNYIVAQETVSGGVSNITGNYFGGSAPECGGNPFTWVGNAAGEVGNSPFWMIELTISAGATLNVNNNVIKNFDYTITYNSIFRCFNIENYGTLNMSGNIIGDVNQNNSIKYTAKTNDGAFYGIVFSGTGTSTIENNTIAGVTCNNESPLYATNFYGVSLNGNNTIFRNNIIGSETIGNSIISTSVCTDNPQYVYGIVSSGNGVVISNNIISNLTNGTNSSTTNIAGRIAGINVTGGYATIDLNQIKNLKISNANSATGNSNSISAITYAATSGIGIISRNKIYNIENNFSGFSGEIYGVYLSAGTYANKIELNFIHSLKASGTSTSASIYGIMAVNGTSTISNNILTLGDNAPNTFYGIYDSGSTSQTCNLYHNTIYIKGAPTTGSANSYALYSNANSNTKNYRNNIFWNARTRNGAWGGKHYAIYYKSIYFLTANNNDYLATGTGGVLAYYNSADRTTLAALQAAIGQDAKSISTDPLLASAGGSEEINYVPNYRKLFGMPGTGITTDYAGVTRNYFPTMGAYDIALDLPVQAWKNGVMEATYGNLKHAFDNINSGAHTGSFELRITESIEETASAVLYYSGYNGISNYSSIHIFPTVSGLSVSGNLNAPMIDFNGADRVTLDGRVNGTGDVKDLTIVNTNTSSTTITSTIRLINDATYNTIKYCNLKGSNQGSGIVFLSLSYPAATYPLGNSYNTIENNNFTNHNNIIPRNAIRADNWGTTGYSTNKNITVTNNYFYNLLPSRVIYFGNNTQSGTITGNSFYQTNIIVVTSNNIDNGFIQVNACTGSTGYNVSNNYFGGSLPECGGTPLTKASPYTSRFEAVSICSSGTNTVQNNLLTNIDWTNATGEQWIGFSVGNIGVNNVSNNTIGSSEKNDAIIITNGNLDSSVWGIYSIGSITGNKIGGITIRNSGNTNRTYFWGIFCSQSANIENNLIGSLTISNSINNTSPSTSSEQNVVGLYLRTDGGGIINARNNTISNLRNGTTNQNTDIVGRITGIWVEWGNVNIENNIIKNLSISNANSSSTHTASAGGIVINPYNNQWNFYSNIKANQISNIFNDKTDFSGSIHGIYYCANYSASNEVSRNIISNLRAIGNGNLNAKIIGINAFNGSSTYSNNIITLGDNTSNTFYGIFDTGTASQNCNLYFNTVYIGGSPTSGANNSYAFFSNANGNTRNYRNNIFANFRSNNGASGKHYAAYFNYASTGSLTLSNNNYYTAGNGGVLGYYNSADVTSLPIIPGYDNYSISGNPYFTNAGGTNAVDYKLSFTKPIGVAGTGITVDFGNNTRSAYPAMGAWEFDGPNLWKGNISTDWANGYNWTAGYVPASGADITFDPYPMNHAILDQDRIIGSLNNAQSTYRAVTNGKKLTINGALNLTNGAQIDASANNSTLEFAGTTETQYIQSGNLYEDKVYNLSVKNPNNVVLSGSLRLLNALSSETGVLDASTNAPTLVFGGTNQQNSSGATLLSGRAYNVTVDNSAGAVLTGNMLIENILTLQQGDISTDNYKLTLQGNTIGNGGYITTNANAGTIEYAGTSAQTIRRIKDNTANTLLITNTSLEGATIIGNDNSFGDLNTFNNVSIAVNSTLNVEAGDKLTVNNNLSNEGTFKLLSNSNGTATLLTNGSVSANAGTYKVQQYLTGSNNGSAPNGRFWYVSSPVTGALSGTFNPASSLNKLWTWDEPTHGYIQLTNNATPLANGKGYVARMGNTGTVEFSSSVINNGNITLNGLSWTGQTHINRGYNLIGNPYPSFLNWKDVWVDPNTGDLRTSGLPNKMRATIWVRSANSTLYTYNAIAGTYATTNPQAGEISEQNIQYIAPMQAFWVETFDPEITDGSISFNNSMRSHQLSSENRLRAKAAPNTEKQELRLSITDGTNTDQTVVQFNSKASDTYDLYDSHKMSLSGIPQLYTKAGKEVLSINGMASFTNEKIVPLGFSVPQAGVYTLKASEISNFSSGTQVLLVDNATASVTDLTLEDTYDFTSDKVDNYNRFTIIFRSPGTVTETPNSVQGNIVIYKNGDNKITVICNEEIKFNASVTVYSAAGQVIFNKALSGTTTVVDKEFSPGVYIARVYNGEKIVSAKVIVE